MRACERARVGDRGMESIVTCELASVRGSATVEEASIVTCERASVRGSATVEEAS
jgi:hypothetical protein